MEWIGVAALIGALFFIIKVTGDSKFVKRQNEKAIKDADKWAKKNKKYIKRMDRIEDKYVVTPLRFIFKAIFIIAGISIFVYLIGIAGSGLKSLYYGSPFLFLFLMWLIFFRPRN